MKLDDNLFAFTSWLMRNTHVETETGLTEFDGYDWYNSMWNKWLHNSDAGRKIINNGVIKNNNNPGTTITNTMDKITGQNNTGVYPEPGQVWIHYKGGRYEIIAMCNHTTTNEPLVIYKSKSFNGFHARPYSEWHDEVVDGGKYVRRFGLVN